MDQLLIVGLGNPGKKYAMTRHNMGYLVVEGMAQTLGVALREESKLKVNAGRASAGGVNYHLVQPTTYMNDSGLAVRKYCDYYKIAAEQVLVVVDDIALPFGEMRIRNEGGTGGHNGLKSIQAHLGTNRYPRLRVGIGDRDQGELTDHVLGGFSKKEVESLPLVLHKAIQVLQRFPREPLEELMQDVNQRVRDKKNIPQARIAGQENTDEKG